MVNHNYTKEISGCGLVGIFDTRGKRMPGELVLRSVAALHERGNGLGGGFAAYGIYPKHKDFFAFHMLLDNEPARKQLEDFLAAKFHIELGEPIPTRSPDERYPEKSAGINPEEAIFPVKPPSCIPAPAA